jgi:diacylglycerol O-acyltransferase / wax synthase
MDTAKAPGQFGVMLVLDPAPGFDLGVVRALIDQRIPALPRFRQRLLRTPFGCGGPIWVDDPRFDLADHVTQLRCQAPHDRQTLLDTALSAIATPLRKDAPLWAARLLTGLGDGRVALVLVLHHALADGVGGLAVLAHLVDGTHPPERPKFPRPAPAATTLAREAFLGKLRALRDCGQSWQMLRRSAGASGGVHPPRAAPCSLVQRTGPHRRLEVASADLAAVRAAAHRHGATVNDAVLVVVAGALRQVLAARGEQVDPLVVTVPVSGRGQAGREALGNMVSPMLVPVPMASAPGERLEQVAGHVLAHKAAATAPAPIALLGGVFRPLARLGGYRWYMNHQHRLHTLVSHVRGPAEQVSFGGSAVVSAIPAGVADAGNLTVYFEVLSYAGTLTVTAITDPDHFPRTDLLADAMRAEFDLMIANAPGRIGTFGSGRCPARS